MARQTGRRRTIPDDNPNSACHMERNAWVFRLAMAGDAMSPDVIRREFNALKISVPHKMGTEQKYAMPNRASAKARRIYRSLSMSVRC